MEDGKVDSSGEVSRYVTGGPPARLAGWPPGRLDGQALIEAAARAEVGWI